MSPKIVKLVTTGVGLITLSLLIYSFIEIPKLNTSYSINQFFPDHHPLFIQGQEFKKTFYMEETPSFLVILSQPKDSPSTNWLDSDQIESLKKVRSDLSQNEKVQDVFSLVDVEGVFETEQELTVGQIFDHLPQEKWAGYVQDQKLISKRLLSQDMRSTLLLIEPVVLGPQEMNLLSREIHSTVQKISPHLKVEVGGIPAIQGRFAEKLLSELKIYLILCFLIFCLAFSFLIGGKSALLLMVLTLASVNLTSLAVLAHLQIPFSVLLTTLPIISSIVIASLCVHCFHLWSERLADLSPSEKVLGSPERWVASLSVLKDLALPNFLGSLTTAIGFCSLAFSEVPMIKQYGLSVSGTVMVGWALSHLMLFGLMHLSSPQPRKTTQSWSLWFTKWLQFQRPIVFGIALLTVSFAWIGKDIEFSSRLFDDLPKNEDAREVTEKIDRDFGGVVSFDLILKSTTDGFFKSLGSAKKINKGLESLASVQGVGSVASYTQFLDSSALTSDAKLAEALFLFTLSPKNPLQSYVTDDGKQLRLAFNLTDRPSSEVEETRKVAEALFQSLFPNSQVIQSGLAVRAHTINQEVSSSLIFGFFESLLLIFGFLIVVFRSFKWALISCVPNFIPPAALLGAMALFQTPIKPTIALIFSIALGLAFNNTLYILGRLKKICGERRPNEADIRQTLSQEASPCSFESLLMFFGFMIFLTSSFQVNQTFGVYMLLSIASGFIGDLVFLPSFLKSLFVGQADSETEDLSVESPATEESLRRVASFVLLSLMVGWSAMQTSPAYGDIPKDVQAVLNQVQKKLEAKDDQAKATMVIKEPNGQTKKREMNILTLRADQFYTRIKILSPADVKGTGFLGHLDPPDEKHWIYIPSTKKVRRVVGDNKSAGILGSELTIEDLDPTALKAASVKVQSKDSVKSVLEVTPKAGTSPYSKVLTAISEKSKLPLRTVYYKGNKKAKIVNFLDYKEVGKDIWRAQKIEVQNLENKRGTDLLLENMKSNTGLKKDQFSTNALKFDSL